MSARLNRSLLTPLPPCGLPGRSGVADAAAPIGDTIPAALVLINGDVELQATTPLPMPRAG